MGESPVVREVINNPARPLRVRILLEERESSRPLVLRGSHLTVNEDSLRDSELRCSFEDEWVCLSKGSKSKTNLNKKKRIYRGKITIQSDDDFIRMGKSFYRDTIQLVPRKNKLLIVNELELESYLVGIVNSEVSSKYPREALKAQVVAARSYALACVRERKKSKEKSSYDLDSTEMDQVYKGAQVEDPMSHFVVQETKGEVLRFENRIVKAYYHASSGGSLEKPSAVWGTVKADEDVYSVNDPASRLDDDLKWKISFGAWIGLKIPGLGLLRDMQIVEFSPSDRVKKILMIGEMDSKVIRGAELRKLFGGRWLKSTLFKIEQKGAKWILEGKGFGHGVGMSQRGAKKLAQKGWAYDKILNSYYPGATLGKVGE